MRTFASAASILETKIHIMLLLDSWLLEVICEEVGAFGDIKDIDMFI